MEDAILVFFRKHTLRKGWGLEELLGGAGVILEIRTTSN